MSLIEVPPIKGAELERQGDARSVRQECPLIVHPVGFLSLLVAITLLSTLVFSAFSDAPPLLIMLMFGAVGFFLDV
jgi:hypothetical protein